MVKLKTSELEEEAKKFIINPENSLVDRMMVTYGYQHRFIKTEHPLPVWDAISLCCQEGIDFPSWVREYLKNASEKLLAIGDDKAEQEEYPTAVLKALHLNSKKAVFTRHNKHYPKEIKTLMGVENVKKEFLKQGMERKLYGMEACTRYAKSTGQSPATVYDIYRKAKNSPAYEFLVEE